MKRNKYWVAIKKKYCSLSGCESGVSIIRLTVMVIPVGGEQVVGREDVVHITTSGNYLAKPS